MNHTNVHNISGRKPSLSFLPSSPIIRHLSSTSTIILHHPSSFSIILHQPPPPLSSIILYHPSSFSIILHQPPPPLFSIIHHPSSSPSSFINLLHHYPPSTSSIIPASRTPTISPYLCNVYNIVTKNIQYLRDTLLEVIVHPYTHMHTCMYVHTSARIHTYMYICIVRMMMMMFLLPTPLQLVAHHNVFGVLT